MKRHVLQRKIGKKKISTKRAASSPLLDSHTGCHPEHSPSGVKDLILLRTRYLEKLSIVPERSEVKDLILLSTNYLRNFHQFN